MGYGQVCGVSPLTVGAGQEAAADIPMEENVGYGVTNPLTVGAGQEAAADIPIEENVGYGVTNQVCETAADITMEENVGYGVTSDSKRLDESYEYIFSAID